MSDASSGPADPGSAPRDSSKGPDLERLLMEADRMTLTIVQTSLSLIGFGFSINAFFNDVASRSEGLDADLTARRLGLALLSLGLLLLGMGIWNQARYRRTLMRRYSKTGHERMVFVLFEGGATPPFVTAFLLLLIGLGAFASILLRGLF